MVVYALVGRCGIYCGSCGLYRAYRDDGEYLQQVSTAWAIPSKRIRCEGCHALTPDCAGAKCRVVNCLNHNGYEYCFECSEYEQQSCDKHNDLAKKWAIDNVDLRANLERIRSGDLETWLKECDEKFRCPKCQKSLPVLGWNVAKKCYHCGAVL